MEDSLSKVSSFYTKDGTKYEKKMCNFILKNIHEDVPEEKQILKQLDYDMSKYANRH